ncbi:MAG: hypothetical protein VKO39_06560 [Cyanobacteriota bacterium]|nr:hypothetical protein [Cyanobacteriota bacterium]
MIEAASRISRMTGELASGHGVIVVGSGMSMASCGQQQVEGHRVASWRGLLEHGAQHLQSLQAADAQDLQLLLQQIHSGKASWMIQAAEMITAG